CGAVRRHPPPARAAGAGGPARAVQPGQPAGHRQLRRDRGGGRPLQLWLEARAAGMSGLNTLIRLPAADSTNVWAKANLDRFGPVGAVYTTNQTAGPNRSRFALDRKSTRL